ncbi:predicted protein [Nematostella vectensis]|uniref:Homeobox domain-containing protein n=1 Tax=Nematostella vectensis TaxID=45351 RepID=A7RMB1_NEMVE|nr:predicted protein [Nematostella vectensis]|eukprot:XP_001639537.1 predicted protein [Nematostella vectensis]
MGKYRNIVWFQNRRAKWRRHERKNKAPSFGLRALAAQGHVTSDVTSTSTPIPMTSHMHASFMPPCEEYPWQQYHTPIVDYPGWSTISRHAMYHPYSPRSALVHPGHFTTIFSPDGYTGYPCFGCRPLEEGHVTGWSATSDARFEHSALFPARGLLQFPYSVMDLRHKASLHTKSMHRKQVETKRE